MRVLVIFHVYYENLAGYYLGKMTNICGCQWDLIVTGSSFSEELKESVRTVKKDALFIETENVGYDIWPFISAIKHTDLSNYDFVIKLHTKNEDGFQIKLNKMNMDGKRWKELMVEPIIGTSKNFASILDIFRKNPKAGIVFNRQVGFRVKTDRQEDCEMLDSEMSRLGIVPKRKFFCAGTMFAVKASALKFLQDEKITSTCFATPNKSHSGATLAHVYERLIPVGVLSQDLKYVPLYDNFGAFLRFLLKDTFSPALEWIFSINKYKDDAKLITIFGFKHIHRKHS